MEESDRMTEGVDDWTCLFVSSLRGDLTSILNETSDELARLPSMTDLDEYISKPFPLNPTLLTIEDRKMLDDTGVEVWNACNREFVKPERTSRMENMGDLCKVAVIAFLLIECAMGDGGKCLDYIRLLNAGLRTGGRMIGMGHPDLAIKVFEKLAEHDARISQIGSQDVNDLAAECSFQLSILLWKNLQPCELSSKPIPLSIQKDPQVRAKAVDILYCIGIAKKKSSDPGAISTPRQDDSSKESKTLRQCVLHELIRANLELQELTVAQSERIQILLNDLQQGYGSDPSTLYLGFEVFNTLGPQLENGDVLCDSQLQFLVDKVKIESNFDSIMHCIHKLWLWRPTMAYRNFHCLIQRMKSGKSSSLEKAILIYLRLCTMHPDSSEGLKQSSMLLMSIYLDKPRTIRLGPNASQASRLIFLSKAHTCTNAGESELAFEWCKLTQHPALAKGDEDITQRKIIFYALHLDNAVPLDFIDELAKSRELSIYSQFMLYQYALKHNNLELVRQSLKDIVRGTHLDFSAIYACIAYAESHRKTVMLGPIFRELLTEHHGTIYTIVLLKCCVRIMTKGLSTNQKLATETIEGICQLFEQFSTDICQCGLVEQELIQNLEWFSRNGYNLVVKHHSQWNITYSMRLINSCIKIIGLYPNGLGPDALSNIQQREFWCRTIAVMAHVALGRESADTTSQALYYNSARMHAQHCREYIKSDTQGVTQENMNSLSKALPSLLVLDFECALHLQQEESVCEILDDCGADLDYSLICMLADLVIFSKSANPIAYKAFQRITDMALASGSSCDILQQFRWLRCLYRLALQCEEDRAKFIANRAQMLVDMAALPTSKLPKAKLEELGREMQWLPVAMYNQSLLYFKDMKNRLSKEWYNEAVGLAKWIEYNGWDTKSLSTSMSEAYGALKW